jgi:dimethylaniline monooxygenase (N-oxide forming)
MRALPRVCVIGAGSSGITAAKALYDRGFPFDCYEASDRVGGNWVFENKNGMSSAYRSLHINTSRERMQYADFPMPADYPDFPHHSLIARYFDAYVDHFGFRHKIRFETRVERVEPDPTGGFSVTTSRGARHYDAVIVANGHHWSPQPPNPPIPGSFDGISFHSHYYIDPQAPHDLVGKRVVVLGMGNSAMDIACELSRPGVAERVFLSVRRGAYVIPNYLFGRPLDQILSVLPPTVPFKVQQAFGALLFRAGVGRMEDFGLPRPDHGVGEAHPTISSELLIKLGRGDITPRPGIAALEGSRVRFTDGSTEQVDAVIYCTGYRVVFPFFDPAFLSAPDNDLPLFRRVFKPDRPGLFFVGLFQPLGAIMPIAEAQSKWIVDHLTGDYTLPDVAAMERDIHRERAAMERRYVRSLRHTMQIDFDLYMHELSIERARGAMRRG